VSDLNIYGTIDAWCRSIEGEHPYVFRHSKAQARARGRAGVPLDANFAKVIKTGDYRVFFTPEGDCRGLYLRRKTAASFEVRELMGGKSSIAFSYRIVGRRKDIKEHRRFAKIDTLLPAPAPRKPMSAGTCARSSPEWKGRRDGADRNSRRKADVREELQNICISCLV
jgi:hypothetical protein